MFMYHGYHGYGLVWPIAAIISIIPFWRICVRVGLSPWLSLLLLVPIANIIFVYYVAFGDWPIQRGSMGGMPPGLPPGLGASRGPTPT